MTCGTDALEQAIKELCEKWGARYVKKPTSYKKLLNDPEVRKEYDALKPKYDKIGRKLREDAYGLAREAPKRKGGNRHNDAGRDNSIPPSAHSD